MNPDQDQLAARLRRALAGRGALREVRMFGGLACMLDDRMVASAQKDGSLLIRVDEGRHEELLRIPGARQAEMGTGRTMGPGWILVAPSEVAGEGGLERWLAPALERHAAHS